MRPQPGLWKDILVGTMQDAGEMMRELDCGCGCHLEGKDEQGLVVKYFLHLEAAHPEIEEPTIEL